VGLIYRNRATLSIALLAVAIGLGLALHYLRAGATAWVLSVLVASFAVGAIALQVWLFTGRLTGRRDTYEGEYLWAADLAEGHADRDLKFYMDTEEVFSPPRASGASSAPGIHRKLGKAAARRAKQLQSPVAASGQAPEGTLILDQAALDRLVAAIKGPVWKRIAATVITLIVGTALSFVVQYYVPSHAPAAGQGTVHSVRSGSHPSPGTS
jgi:uncharacterized membrane protein YraQ (UPF0718 family)